MLKRLSDISATEPRMALALAFSVLLHLSLLLQFDPPQPEVHALRSNLTVSFSEKTAVAESAGIPAPSTPPTVPVVPGSGRLSAGATASANAASKPSEVATVLTATSPRNVTFVVNSAVLGEFVVGEIPRVPATRDPAYIPIDRLAPRPQLPEKFDIEYPEGAKRAGIKAAIRIAVLIDETGRVVEAADLDSIPGNDILVAAAVKALRSARFQPGQAGGLPVRSKIAVMVRFSYE